MASTSNTTTMATPALWCRGDDGAWEPLFQVRTPDDWAAAAAAIRDVPPGAAVVARTCPAAWERTLAERMAAAGASPEMVGWAAAYGTDSQGAWDECTRGDYMAWWADQADVDGTWEPTYDHVLEMAGRARDAALDAFHRTAVSGGNADYATMREAALAAAENAYYRSLSRAAVLIRQNIPAAPPL